MIHAQTGHQHCKLFISILVFVCFLYSRSAHFICYEIPMPETEEAMSGIFIYVVASSSFGTYFMLINGVLKVLNDIFINAAYLSLSIFYHFSSSKFGLTPKVDILAQHHV